MKERQPFMQKSLLRVFCMYSVLSFALMALFASGVNDNSSMDISLFADRMVYNNLVLLGFSLAYGFSALIFRAKSLSSPAKYSIHIAINYIASMVSVFLLFSYITKDNPEISPTTWMAVLLVASVIFFVIYGIASLIIYFVKKYLIKA